MTEEEKRWLYSGVMINTSTIAKSIPADKLDSLLAARETLLEIYKIPAGTVENFTVYEKIHNAVEENELL